MAVLCLIVQACNRPNDAGPSGFDITGVWVLDPTSVEVKISPNIGKGHTRSQLEQEAAASVKEFKENSKRFSFEFGDGGTVLLYDTGYVLPVAKAAYKIVGNYINILGKGPWSKWQCRVLPHARELEVKFKDGDLRTLYHLRRRSNSGGSSH